MQAWNRDGNGGGSAEDGVCLACVVCSSDWGLVTQRYEVEVVKMIVGGTRILDFENGVRLCCTMMLLLTQTGTRCTGGSLLRRI